MVSSTKRDLLGEWFSALEAYGECFTFRLGRCRAPASEPEWFFLPHSQYDGLGGLAHVQRTVLHRGLELPRSGERPLGGFLRMLAALRWLLRRYPRPLPWRRERNWRPVDASGSTPVAVAWALLSESETEAVRAQARERGVSVTAWLLWSLSRSSLPRLADSGGCLDWIVPVNMRGAVVVEPDTANSASALDVAFSTDAGPELVHAAIQQEIRRRSHWGAWQLVSLLRYLAPEALKRLAYREMQVKKHGSFSNLGTLGPREGEREWWMAFNPVLCSRPVGAASLTWGGRLALTLQLHPVLSQEPEEARAWLNEWVDLALARTDHGAARCLPAPAASLDP